MLLALPRDLGGRLLSLWLLEGAPCGLRDISSLDAAFCGAETRAHFLDLLLAVRVDRIQIMRAPVALLRWLSSRQVNVKMLQLGVWPDMRLSSTAAWVLPTVRCITMTGAPSHYSPYDAAEDAASFLQRVPSLKHLNLSNDCSVEDERIARLDLRLETMISAVSRGPLVAVVLRSATTLQSLSLHNATAATVRALASTLSPRLVALGLSFVSAVPQQPLIALLLNNPALASLSLSTQIVSAACPAVAGDEAFVRELVRSTPRLVQLTVWIADFRFGVELWEWLLRSSGHRWTSIHDQSFHLCESLLWVRNGADRQSLAAILRHHSSSPLRAIHCDLLLDVELLDLLAEQVRGSLVVLKLVVDVIGNLGGWGALWGSCPVLRRLELHVVAPCPVQLPRASWALTANPSRECSDPMVDVLAEALQRCPAVSSLKLLWPAASDEAVAALLGAERREWAAVVDLDLDGCQLLSASTMRTALRHLPALRMLSMRDTLVLPADVAAASQVHYRVHFRA